MEYGSIERELYIDASPEVVFEVISRPEHLREWWPEEATLDSRAGGRGELRFRPDGAEETVGVPMAIVEHEPPHHFSFRWAYDDGVEPDVSNSLLATFDLAPSGAGTVVRFIETGFRERGWDAAVLEAMYNDHVEGWNHFLPRLVSYAAQAVPAP